MPRSMARWRAAMAFSSSPYIRKRLPQPKARMETLALVRPSVRVGSDKAPGGCASARSGKRDKPTLAVVTPRLSRNFCGIGRGSWLPPSSGENDCTAEWLDEKTMFGMIRSPRYRRIGVHDLVLRLAGCRGKIEPWRQHYS